MLSCPPAASDPEAVAEWLRSLSPLERLRATSICDPEFSRFVARMCQVQRDKGPGYFVAVGQVFTEHGDKKTRQGKLIAKHRERAVRYDNFCFRQGPVAPRMPPEIFASMGLSGEEWERHALAAEALFQMAPLPVSLTDLNTGDAATSGSGSREGVTTLGVIGAGVGGSTQFQSKSGIPVQESPSSPERIACAVTISVPLLADCDRLLSVLEELSFGAFLRVPPPLTPAEHVAKPSGKAKSPAPPQAWEYVSEWFTCLPAYHIATFIAQRVDLTIWSAFRQHMCAALPSPQHELGPKPLPDEPLLCFAARWWSWASPNMRHEMLSAATDALSLSSDLGSEPSSPRSSVNSGVAQEESPVLRSKLLELLRTQSRAMDQMTIINASGAPEWLESLFLISFENGQQRVSPSEQAWFRKFFVDFCSLLASREMMEEEEQIARLESKKASLKARRKAQRQRRREEKEAQKELQESKRLEEQERLLLEHEQQRREIAAHLLLQEQQLQMEEALQQSAAVSNPTEEPWPNTPIRTPVPASPIHRPRSGNHDDRPTQSPSGRPVVPPTSPPTLVQPEPSPIVKGRGGNGGWISNRPVHHYIPVPWQPSGSGLPVLAAATSEKPTRSRSGDLDSSKTGLTSNPTSTSKQAKQSTKNKLARRRSASSGRSQKLQSPPIKGAIKKISPLKVALGTPALPYTPSLVSATMSWAKVLEHQSRPGHGGNTANPVRAATPPVKRDLVPPTSPDKNNSADDLNGSDQDRDGVSSLPTFSRGVAESPRLPLRASGQRSKQHLAEEWPQLHPDFSRLSRSRVHRGFAEWPPFWVPPQQIPKKSPSPVEDILRKAKIIPTLSRSPSGPALNEHVRVPLHRMVHPQEWPQWIPTESQAARNFLGEWPPMWYPSTQAMDIALRRNSSPAGTGGPTTQVDLQRQQLSRQTSKDSRVLVSGEPTAGVPVRARAQTHNTRMRRGPLPEEWPQWERPRPPLPERTGFAEWPPFFPAAFADSSYPIRPFPWERERLDRLRRQDAGDVIGPVHSASPDSADADPDADADGDPLSSENENENEPTSTIERAEDDSEAGTATVRAADDSKLIRGGIKHRHSLSTHEFPPINHGQSPGSHGKLRTGGSSTAPRMAARSRSISRYHGEFAAAVSLQQDFGYLIPDMVPLLTDPNHHELREVYRSQEAPYSLQSSYSHKATSAHLPPWFASSSVEKSGDPASSEASLVAPKPSTAQPNSATLSALLAGAPSLGKQQFLDLLHAEIELFDAYVTKLSLTNEPIGQIAIDRVRSSVLSLWSHAEVKAYGSFATSLWLPCSDLDLVILGVNTQKFGVRSALHQLACCLGRERWVTSVQVIHAKVPLIKLISCISHANILVDITFDEQGQRVGGGEQQVGAVATGGPGTTAKVGIEDLRPPSEASGTHQGVLSVHLIRHYLAEFPQLRPLLLVLKQLLFERGLAQTYTGGLSSYCLVMMMVAFLQSRLSLSTGNRDAGSWDSSPGHSPVRGTGAGTGPVSPANSPRNSGHQRGRSFQFSPPTDFAARAGYPTEATLRLSTISPSAATARAINTPIASQPVFPFAITGSSFTMQARERRHTTAVGASVIPSANVGNGTTHGLRRRHSLCSPLRITSGKVGVRHGPTAPTRNLESAATSTADEGPRVSSIQLGPSGQGNLGELLLGFLEFYGRQFDYRRVGIAPMLHSAGTQPGGPHHTGCFYYLRHLANTLVISDPLDPTYYLDPTRANNIGKGVFAMYRIKAAFDYAHSVLSAPFSPNATQSLLSRIIEGPSTTTPTRVIRISGTPSPEVSRKLPNPEKESEDDPTQGPDAVDEEDLHLSHRIEDYGCVCSCHKTCVCSCQKKKNEKPSLLSTRPIHREATTTQSIDPSKLKSMVLNRILEFLGTANDPSAKPNLLPQESRTFLDATTQTDDPSQDDVSLHSFLTFSSFPVHGQLIIDDAPPPTEEDQLEHRFSLPSTVPPALRAVVGTGGVSRAPPRIGVQTAFQWTPFFDPESLKPSH